MEKWRDIPGYENLYQASDRGQIRTCEGKVTRNARYAKRVWKQRILRQKLHPNKKGRVDARVHLWKNGKGKTFLVSRLVAMAWVDGYSPELTVNHKDGNPLNNCADNLEWVSLVDNIRDGFESGLYAANQIPVVVVRGDEISIYRSLSEASRAIGKNPGYLSGKYIKQKKRRMNGG